MQKVETIEQSAALGLTPTNHRVPEPVAIIGGGMGGLCAAIHLKLAGFNVTIYEANERVGGRANLIVRNGFHFDTGPSLLNYPWVFEDLFKAAGRRLQDYVTLLPVDPSITFQWPDKTCLTLSSNLQRLLEEFDRIEPGVRPRLLAFLRDAAEKYRLSFDKLVTSNEESYLKWLSALSAGELMRTAIWRSLDRELGRFFKSRYIREALGSYGMYLGGSPYSLPGLFSILSYGELAFGLWLPKGGIYGLISAIEKLALELGIKILIKQRVRKIVLKDGRVTGIELEDGTIHQYSTIVSNVDVPTTDTQLLNRQIEKPKMTPGVLTFYWGIHGRLENIAHHTIFLPSNYRAAFDELLKKKRIPEDMPFYVSVPSATDPDLAPPECSVIFILIPTPLLSEMEQIDWETEKQAIRERVIERLRRNDVKIEAGQIAVEESYTPADWQRRFGLFDGSAFGAAHTLLQMGPLRARNYSKDIEGLFYVGASTTPGTGLPMVALGGKMVAERVKERTTKAQRA